MFLKSHISAYARCLAGKVCSLVRSTWGSSRGEDKLGAKDRILNTKVAHRACTRRAPGKHPPAELQEVLGSNVPRRALPGIHKGHCIVERTEDGHVWLEARNGRSLVNGKAVQRVELKHNDRVWLGTAYAFLFKFPGKEAEGTIFPEDGMYFCHALL